jgi:hypothetical protein
MRGTHGSFALLPDGAPPPLGERAEAPDCE